MPGPAYACLISEENLGAIRSEHPKFDLVEIRAWMEQHGRGYFLRDEDSVFDCKYLEETVFFQLYQFEGGDLNQLFLRVIKR